MLLVAMLLAPARICPTFFQNILWRRNGEGEDEKSLIFASYEHLPQIGKGPAYTLSGRTEGKAEAGAPGPGAYDTSSRLGGPAYSLSGRADNRMDSNSPGPGAYDHSTHVGKGMGSTIAGRLPNKLDNDVPGPGMISPLFSCFEFVPSLTLLLFIAGAYSVDAMPNKKAAFSYSIGPGLPPNLSELL